MVAERFLRYRPVKCGDIVHVRGSAGPCRPALVLAWGPVVCLLRVFGRSEREQDEWGDVRHHSSPLSVPSPDGTMRVLDNWHGIGECDWGE